MAHIYMTFDFGTDEEKAQQARHKLDGWKQAFRLDKKLLYKFERATLEVDGRSGPEPVLAQKEAAKTEKLTKRGKAGKSAATKVKPEREKAEESAAAAGPVTLHLRLGVSRPEKR